jgi:hypothetical protein
MRVGSKSQGNACKGSMPEDHADYREAPHATHKTKYNAIGKGGFTQSHKGETPSLHYYNTISTVQPAEHRKCFLNFSVHVFFLK